MKKALPLALILFGATLVIASLVFWVDTITGAEPVSFGESLRDWLIAIVGLGASIKGWMDLLKKEGSSAQSQSNKNGGIIISGKIENIGDDIVGRDKIVHTYVSEDFPFNVEGLLNPYLGLRPFTYEERDRYAGREKLTEEAVQLLVSPGEQRNLLFVTGASGSGKSSFVQAGLLPAIAAHYKELSYEVHFEVFRPSRNPKTRYEDAIRRMGPRGIKVIVIDQFEEVFTQSLPSERDGLFDILRKLPPFNKNHRYTIATLRSDYLGEMFDVPEIWNLAKQGVELHEMNIQELKNSIQRPLQVKFPDRNKRFEAELINKLAKDAAESVTYLPLLQVTLEELWNKGKLNIGSYNVLTDAIKDRADTVLNYSDFDSASPISKRNDIEREEILTILLDLVNPSSNDNSKHDVRISRKLSEFNEKQITLLRELSRARLVSIEVEEGIEIVNLIHETLIHSWDILQNGVKEKRLQLQRRARFEEQLRDWIAHDRADGFLLSEGQLTEALELKYLKDIALQTDNAQEFLQKSEEKIETDAQLTANLERRILEMNALTRVSQGVNISLSFDDVMELIFAQTGQIIPASEFHITLYSEAGDYYYYAFCVENRERLEERESIPQPLNLGLGQEVIRKGRPILTQDYLHECQARNVTPAFQDVFAWMGVPLNAGAETIGSLGVGSRDASVTYSRAQLDLLQAIADQTAGVIVKARLLQETQQRAHQLSTLNDLTRQLTSTLELEPLLQNIMENAVSILNCEAGSLFLVDEQTDDLVFKVTVGPSSVAELIGQRVPAGSGIVGRAAQQREPVVENRTQTSPARFLAENNETSFTSKSLLAVPLLFKDRVIGVIEVINRKDGLPFIEDDQTLLSAFAGQAAVGIENARLFTLTDQELASRVEELSVMQRIDRELNASLEIDRAMRITLEWAMRQSKAEAGLIGMLADEKLRVMAEQGYGDLNGRFADGILSLDMPAVKSAVQMAQPQQVSLQSDAEGSILPGAHTQIVIPIRREADVIGLLLLESVGNSQQDLAFLNRLSDHAAIAISNAQLYEEFRMAMDAKGDAISFVAHELKNPLVSIKGYTELLATGAIGEVNEMQTKFLHTIRLNVERMSTLVSDLNDDSKIEAGRLRIDYKAVDLFEVVDEVIRSTRLQFEGKKQEILVQISEAIPGLWADQTRVSQVLTNIVSNAHKYTPEEGKIIVGAEVTANQWDPEGAAQVVHIWVKDNGIGISVEDQQKIFSKFFRSDDQKAREVPGAGLSLNIAKSLVEMQGGKIWFESEFRNGTTFHFTVPVAEE